MVFDAVPDPHPPAEAAASNTEAESKQQEGEVPIAVAETEQSQEDLAEVVVQGLLRNRRDVIHNLVTEAQALLDDFELQYVLTGKGKRKTLRGRPVAFALWSEELQEWT